MEKKYTISDFLHTTKYCFGCGNVANLYIYSVDDDYLTNKQLTFDIYNDNLTIDIKKNFYNKLSSYLTINSKTHKYFKNNIQDLKFSFLRTCNDCKQYQLESYPITLNGVIDGTISPVKIKYMGIILSSKKCIYSVNQFNDNKVEILSMSSNTSFTINNINLLSIDKEWLLKKIDRYLIL